MARFTFSDGRWLEMRPPSISATRIIMEGVELGAMPKGESRDGWLATYNAHVDLLLGQMERHRIDASWGPDEPLGDWLTEHEIGPLITSWHQSAKDAALPPAEAATSPSSTPRPSSPAPTGSRGKSSTRRSTSTSSTPPAS